MPAAASATRAAVRAHGSRARQRRGGAAESDGGGMGEEADACRSPRLRWRRRRRCVVAAALACHARGAASRSGRGCRDAAALRNAARSAPALLAVASRHRGAICARCETFAPNATDKFARRPPPSPPQFARRLVGKLRADGADLSKRRADLTKHTRRSPSRAGVATRRRAAVRFAKLTGALGATDAELRRLCDRARPARGGARAARRRVGVAARAADAKRAEHVALAARQAHGLRRAAARARAAYARVAVGRRKPDAIGSRTRPSPRRR